MKYNIGEIDNKFYQKTKKETIEQLKEKHKETSVKLGLLKILSYKNIYEGRTSIAQDLKQVYDYIIGWQSKGGIKDILDDICKLVWHNPFIQNQSYKEAIQWQKWRATRLGFMIQVAYDKLKVENGGKLTANELARLSGMTKSTISLYCRNGNIKANKKSREWIINNKVAKEYINQKKQVKIK